MVNEHQMTKKKCGGKKKKKEGQFGRQNSKMAPPVSFFLVYMPFIIHRAVYLMDFTSVLKLYDRADLKRERLSG